jgi:hypothetical protein
MKRSKFRVEVQKNQTNNQDLAAAMPPGHFRIILKLQAASYRLLKPQAASLTNQDYKII